MATLGDIARITVSKLTTPASLEAAATINKVRIFPNIPTPTQSTIYNVFGFAKTLPNERILLCSFTANPDRPSVLRHFLNTTIPIYRDSRTNKLKRIADATASFIDPVLQSPTGSRV